MGGTHFSLAYSAKAVALVEVIMPIARIMTYHEEKSEELLKNKMDLLKKRIVEFQLSLAAYQQ